MWLPDHRPEGVVVQAVAIVFGFGNERIVVHAQYMAVVVVQLGQSVFGIVGEALYAVVGAALFHGAAKGVVAVAFVLVGQHLIVAHITRAAERAVEQIGCGVPSEGRA